MDIHIEGHGGALTIETIEFENAAAQSTEDANWITCAVRIELLGGAVQARYLTSFTTHDFVAFYAELESAVSRGEGTAAFLPYEPTLRILVSVKPRGAANIEASAVFKGTAGARLDVSLQSDCSFLARTISDLAAVTTAFPIRQVNGN